MREYQETFKAPPKRFQPKGLSILYEDPDILVVNKTSGLLTVSSEKVKEQTAWFLLNEYVKKGNAKSRNRVFILHRLDKDTSGVIVFAKSEEVQETLQAQWQGVEKKYYAVIHGTLTEKEGVISSYLVENSAHRVYSVTDPEKGKLARTGYRVVRESKAFSLLEIDLLTGRKNQIRVHLSEMGHPVVGDRKYGKKEKGRNRLALHAATLTLLHPHRKEMMTFTAPIPADFEILLGR